MEHKHSSSSSSWNPSSSKTRAYLFCILHRQYHGCWCPGDARMQGINNHDIYLAPVPLTIFRSNSKLGQNSKWSVLKYTLPIATKFCTRHDTVTRLPCVKVAEDDIAFKLAILKKVLHWNDNTCFCNIIQSSKLVLGSLLAKNIFFVQFWKKNFASSRMANCGSGLPAEWPFRSQNAIEASDSPLPGGLWVSVW